MKQYPPLSEQSLVERLRNRAEIRRQIPTRTSSGERDRLADLLEEAADKIERLEETVDCMQHYY